MGLHSLHGLPQLRLVLSRHTLHAQEPQCLLDQRLEVTLKVLQVEDVSCVGDESSLQEDPVQR